MWLDRLRQRLFGVTRNSRPSRRPTAQPTVEHLEVRNVLSTFTAATVGDLIADINAANAQGGKNTINLTSTTYTLTAVDNTTDGPTGLPVIAPGDQLTIDGNGATITRSAGRFRLLDVAADASLTLNDLTLQNGFAFGSGVAAEGGGIFSQGKLTLNDVTMTINSAVGASGTAGNPGTDGQDAAGGAIFA
ncbi:MAG TPA: hypothetical protein VKD72_23950, partial [Gemmataceae bacterium]|nr:hypothetical protein [Gemmataceae bacterium]